MCNPFKEEFGRLSKLRDILELFEDPEHQDLLFFTDITIVCLAQDIDDLEKRKPGNCMPVESWDRFPYNKPSWS